MKKLSGVLETCIYADDLAAAEQFYRDVLGLEVLSHVSGRHVFFRCGQSVFLVFNPNRTSTDQSTVGGAIVPLHGARGAGHAAFRVAEQEFSYWRKRLVEAGVVVESEVTWPEGGHSLYFRDSAGNSIELATPQLWDLGSAGSE